MKNNKKLIVVLLLTVFLITVLASASACTSKKEYKISFYAEEELIGSVVTAGREILAFPDAPEKDGYTFMGWYRDKGEWKNQLTIDDYKDFPVTEDFSVFAYYVENSQILPQEYVITFYDGNKVIATVTTCGNEVIDIPSAPYKDGYSFVGWYFDKDVWSETFDANSYAGKPLEENLNIYAYYKKDSDPQPQEYTVTFYDGENVISSLTTAGNEILSIPTAPTKEDYEFIGWYLDKDVWSIELTADSYKDKPLTSNLSVYAYYKQSSPVQPEEYLITFYDDKSVIGNVTTAGNETIVLPQAPFKQGYEFIGWYLDKDVWNNEFTADSYKDKPLTDNLNVYAYYKEITFTVSFFTDGGSNVNTVNVSVIMDSPYTYKDGYDFAGWYLDANLTQKAEFPFYPSKDTVLYAKWEAKTLEFLLDSSNSIIGISGIPEDGVLIIPSSINGVKVQGIASYAFQNNQDIVSVEISSDIVNLGVGCFRDCKNLKSVKMSDKMTVMPDNIFERCTSLNEVTLPASLVEIRSDAFCGSAIRNIVLPKSVKSIWQFAFKDCSYLESIDLGNIKYIGQGVFQNCTSLNKIVFPDSLEEIEGNYMFSGCTNLTEIVLPEKPLSMAYTFLNESAYYDDPANWEDGVLYVGAFLITVGDDFKDKTSYSVKPGTICIADNAFNKSYLTGKLASVTLPDGLKEIGMQAFYYCSMLSSVNIPQSVQRIGEEAFASTPVIKQGQSSYLDGWLLSYYASGNTITVQDGTVGIADGQIVSSYLDITQVVLPDSLKYIGEKNFKMFRNLESINMPSSLVSIGNNAFDNCSKVQVIDLSDCTQLTSIGDTAFSWCKSVKEFYICASVTKLGDSVFNQIPGVVINFEINEDEIPEGFDSSWDFTYADVPLQVNWGVSKN